MELKNIINLNNFAKKAKRFVLLRYEYSTICTILLCFIFLGFLTPREVLAQKNKSYYLVQKSGFGRENLKIFSQNLQVVSPQKREQYTQELNKFLDSPEGKNMNSETQRNDNLESKIKSALRYYDQLESEGFVFGKSFRNRLTGHNIEKVQVPVDGKLEQLNSVPATEYWSEEFTYQLFDVPNDSFYSQQWNLKSLGLETFWPSKKGSDRVKVAIIDDGFNKNHPDGKNFAEVVSVCEVDQASPGGHGMNVAGVIGASTNNGLGVAAINEEVSLLGITVFCSDGAGRGQITSSALIEALNIVSEKGAAILNMSLGGLDQDDKELEDSVKELSQNGVLITVAAGNCGENPSSQGCFVNGKQSTISSDKLYPANDPNVLTVTAYGPNKTLAIFASTGSSVDIAAPGVDVYSLSTDGYTKMQGTSQAAPHVAGAAALLLSVNPNLKREELFDILTKNAHKTDAKFGAGELDILQSLQDPRVLDDQKGEEITSEPKKDPPITDVLLTTIPKSDKTYLNPKKNLEVVDCRTDSRFIEELRFECVDGNRGKVIPVDSSCALASDATEFAKAACRGRIEGSVRILFSVKLQGVSVPNQKTLEVQVGVGGGQLEEAIFKTTVITHKSEGVYTGEVNFNLVEDNDYSFYVKGPVHQRRKFCQNDPKEIFKGVYTCAQPKLTLTEGDNTMDFSAIPLLVGDLPSPDGEQDGIVNARDIAQLRSAIDLAVPTNPEFCDLNYDGACNATDWALLIAALSAKGDEK